MLTPNWDITTIQAYSSKLGSAWKRLSFILHLTTGEQLTPRIIIDSFTEFEQVYEEFRDCIYAIEDSLALGHDPDRLL